jgi:hypothetical protein
MYPWLMRYRIDFFALLLLFSHNKPAICHNKNTDAQCKTCCPAPHGYVGFSFDPTLDVHRGLPVNHVTL